MRELLWNVVLWVLITCFLVLFGWACLLDTALGATVEVTDELNNPEEVDHYEIFIDDGFYMDVFQAGERFEVVSPTDSCIVLYGVTVARSGSHSEQGDPLVVCPEDEHQAPEENPPHETVAGSGGGGGCFLDSILPGYEAPPDLDHQHLIYGPIFKPAMDKAVALTLAYHALLNISGDPTKFQAALVITFDTETMQFYAGPGVLEPMFTVEKNGHIKSHINIMALAHDFAVLPKTHVVCWYITAEHLLRLIERGSA